MAVLEVLQYPDERLRKIAEPVTDFGPETQKIIDDMFETLYHTENCGGYAATQMNIQKRIVVLDASPEKDKPLCLINPEIVDQKGEIFEMEACLSVPGDVFMPIKRAKWVRCKAYDRHGKEFFLEEEGTWLARAFQHEIDHLNGVLFIDYLSPLKRRRVDRKLEKLRKSSIVK